MLGFGIFDIIKSANESTPKTRQLPTNPSKTAMVAPSINAQSQQSGTGAY
jgi:hypothetical protein